MRQAIVMTAGVVSLLALAGCSHRIAVSPPAAFVDAAANGTPSVGIEIGQRAPDFTLTGFDGRRVALADFRGRPVIIDFWAGWCPFCITEFPALERAYQAERATGLVVLGVHRSEGEDQATGERFARDRGATFPLLQDEGDRVYRQFAGGTPAMPMSTFMDREGIIRAKVFGPKTDAQIRTHIEQIR